MKPISFPIIAFALIMVMPGCREERAMDGQYPIQPVPFTSVRMTDNFWAPRIRINHELTIPIAIEQSTITGRIKNFEIAGGLDTGKFASIYPFDDSDVFKIIEGASYSLQTNPDPGLEAYLDTLIWKIGLAQEDDGYLYTYRTIMGDGSHDWIGSRRWEKTHLLSHELYNLGHMYEAAVAHYQATGKRSFLDIAIKSADLVDRDFGRGKFESYPGHQEIEMGLVKLSLATGERRYLDLAKFFLDVRGPGGKEYSQSHLKVTDQTGAVGHAVRAAYMYSGMADVAAMFNDPSYIHALNSIWEDVVHRKIYVTGGIGATGGNEGFAEPYHLPNATAYCETCASIANVFWNHRMFLHHGNSKYMDVLERTLYNALLSGVGLSGDLFFYPNPLESSGQHTRSHWFGCACCPSNISRFIPSVPGYLYAKTKDAVYLNIYADNTASIDLDGQAIEVMQKTGFPWEGDVEIVLNPGSVRKAFSLMLRIPGWTGEEAIDGNLYSFVQQTQEKIRFELNGKEFKPGFMDGYAVIRRKWQSGDRIRLVLPMEVRKVQADERVEAAGDRLAIQRGPLVYCAEWPDNVDKHVLNLLFDRDTAFSTLFAPDLFGGIQLVKTTARQTKRTLDGKVETTAAQDVTLIPYHLWNNRGSGEMMVWLPVTPESTRPLPAPTIAARSTVSASKTTPALMALNDQVEPAHSNDHSWLFYHWWPNRNQVE